MMDDKGRVWVTSNIRQAANPDFCKAGSDNAFAKYFPMPTAGKHAAVYDPETQKFKLLDTCFSTHHLQMGYDKDNTMFFSSPGGQAFGWVNSKVLDATGDAKKAQGWCPAYLDSNGDGKIDPAADKRIPVNGYGIVINPVDNSIWMATTGPTPGHLLRVSLGSNPPTTCMAEIYEPPFNNPKMPGRVRVCAARNRYRPQRRDLDGAVRQQPAGQLRPPQVQGDQRSDRDGAALPGRLDALHDAGTEDEGRYRRQQRGFRILQLGRPVQHAGARREHPDRHRHRLGFAGSVYPQHKEMGGHARSVSDGVLLKRNGRPHRRSQGWLERSRNLGDLRRGYDLAHRRRRWHKEQTPEIPTSPKSFG